MAAEDAVTREDVAEARPDPAQATMAGALAALRSGAVVAVVDATAADKGVALIAAADRVPLDTVELVLSAAGVVAVAVDDETSTRLQLVAIGADGREGPAHAYAVPVDARAGRRTGFSGDDRLRTIRALADPATQPGDLVRPGHVVPVRACEGGVLSRRGLAEAAVDLVRLAGCTAAAVLGVADAPRAPGGLAAVSVDDLIAYRWRHDDLYEVAAEARIPTALGTFRAVACRSRVDGAEHLALLAPADRELRDVRAHRQCLTGHVFGATGCGCAARLARDLADAAASGAGGVVYLRDAAAGSCGERIPDDLRITQQIVRAIRRQAGSEP